MESGLYRGFQRRPADEQQDPRQLARAENAGSSQTGITAVTDLTGLAISFTVDAYPVKVRLWVPFVYSSIAADLAGMTITDSANTVKADSTFTMSTGGGSFPMLAEEYITVAGAYSRKGRLRRNSGTGTMNTFMDATFIAYIEAVEIRI